jgi:hypothetical protein
LNLIIKVRSVSLLDLNKRKVDSGNSSKPGGGGDFAVLKLLKVLKV